VQGTGGPIQAAGGQLSIDAEGNVLVDGRNRGRLRVVTSRRRIACCTVATGCWRRRRIWRRPTWPAGEVTLLQGHLEGSNVDTVRTLVDMIAAQRAFEIGTKVLQANDEMLGQSVNTLGRNT
jgi:flagellar basal-body rod protein FlgF